MSRGITGLIVLSYCLVRPTFVLAEGVDSEPVAATHVYPRLAISGTAVAGLAIGNRCPPSTSDVVTCPPMRGIAGFRLSPRVRLNESWGLGLSGGVVWLGEGEKVSTRWWDLQLEGRYYFGKAAASPSWLSGNLGVTKAVESVPTHIADTGVSVPAHGIGTWGTCVGLAYGHDYELTRYFGLAPELRLLIYGFDDNSRPHIYEQPQATLVLGLSVIGFGAYH